jgi:hypothetical protein
MLGGGAAVWIWPMQIGQLFGSLTIACFSFGSFLALANLLDLLTSGVARYARGADFAVEPRAVGAIFLCVLALPAIWSSFQAFHRVRLCEAGCTAANKDWSAVEIPAERPSLEGVLPGMRRLNGHTISIIPKRSRFPPAHRSNGRRWHPGRVLDRDDPRKARNGSSPESFGPPKEDSTENLMRNLLLRSAAFPEVVSVPPRTLRRCTITKSTTQWYCPLSYLRETSLQDLQPWFSSTDRLTCCPTSDRS